MENGNKDIFIRPETRAAVEEFIKAYAEDPNVVNAMIQESGLRAQNIIAANRYGIAKPDPGKEPS